MIAANVAGDVRRLKDQPGQDILVAGSRTLAQSLIAEGLVDEYRLMVFPVILGSGKRLFGETSQPSTLTLVDAQQLDSGTMILTYHPGSPRRADAD